MALGAAGVLALVAAVLWWQYQATAEDLAVAEKRVQAHQNAAERTREALEQLQAERERAQQAVADARRRRLAIENEARQLRAEIDQLQETDDEVDQWSRRPLPDALADKLRGLGSGDADRDPAGDAAGGADGDDSGAGPDG
ncbi:hypothetical protein SAMN05660831_02062 [Thiohalospira halophila DSM 15071]|uniref:Phage lysis regulatory protein, LysB family n=2 Tax=Thiohalospira halophila TaxID=381300 RepID=A0A1I1U860_9GAMM|nr:hypothetical protein SAMN05660831_02062 [Thiohalospira halophila DSM 15071]